MIWGLGLLVLLVALCIPIVAIALNSPYARSLASRMPREQADRIDDLDRRLQVLEDDMDDLGHAIRELREEVQFLHSLLGKPDQPPPLAPPTT